MLAGSECVADENVFVSISSPSTSKYESVRDLGSPQEAAEKTLNQYVNNEFMSTRIGVKREAEIISVSERESNGTLFYDLEFQVF